MRRFLATVRRVLAGETDAADTPAAAGAWRAEEPPIGDVPLDDPLYALLIGASGPIDVDAITHDSPSVTALRDAGVQLVVPLVMQNRLVGLINLGVRLSGQMYNGEDRRLLSRLAAIAAPTVQVAQVARREQDAALERQRLAGEMRVAQLIQRDFLPRELPALDGWQLSAHYRPARQVGGDFYDFIPLEGGRLGVAIGDVTDKGIPAALVMASTRSILRGAARRFDAPADVLAAANEELCPDIPTAMFVTCLYAVLDPASGRFRFANAGHCLPYVDDAAGPREIRAIGMPLGIMPGSDYEEQEVTLDPGATLLLYSDGLSESHDATREMFGCERIAETLAVHGGSDDVIAGVLARLQAFVGADAAQEDDVTLVVVRRNGRVTDAAREETDRMAKVVR